MKIFMFKNQLTVDGTSMEQSVSSNKDTENSSHSTEFNSG